MIPSIPGTDSDTDLPDPRTSLVDSVPMNWVDSIGSADPVSDRQHRANGLGQVGFVAEKEDNSDLHHHDLDHHQTVRSRLAESARDLNDGTGDRDSRDSLAVLAAVDWLRLGIPEALGGNGGSRWSVVEAIAATSAECLTSGFIFWCQRTFAEYLVASANPWLQQQVLPQVLRAGRFGATGLSNAMKHLAGIESLRVRAQWQGDRLRLDGALPWVSNLVPGQFVVAVAAATEAGEAIVAAIPADAPGLTRSEDLDLLGLRGSNTAALTLAGVTIERDWLISDRARQFLPTIRPAFLLFQCGLVWGVARSALRDVRSTLGDRHHVLLDRLGPQDDRLADLTTQLRALADLTEFSLADTRHLFQVRIALTHLAVAAIGLELEAHGGAAYMTPSRTARRWREVAFLPVLTPSLVQLETELARYTDRAGVLASAGGSAGSSVDSSAGAIA